MSFLLDVNVLVALFDAMHVHHEAAHQWFAEARHRGWATCSLTENGLVRVLSNPAYPGRRTTVTDAVALLREFRGSGRHEFWSAAVSITDPERFHTTRIAGHRQVTDVYLLALAVANGGCLATFDGTIPLQAVAEAGPENIEVVGG